MSGADGILPGQIPQALHGFLQRGRITAGEVGPTHTELEQGIPGEDHIAHLVADAAGGMTGGLQNGEGQLVQLDGIALMEQTIIPELLRLLGAAQHGSQAQIRIAVHRQFLLTQHHRAVGIALAEGFHSAGMVIVGMGEQDHRGFRPQILQLGNDGLRVSAGIDHRDMTLLGHNQIAVGLHQTGEHGIDSHAFSFAPALRTVTRLGMISSVSSTMVTGPSFWM